MGVVARLHRVVKDDDRRLLKRGPGKEGRQPQSVELAVTEDTESVPRVMTAVALMQSGFEGHAA